MKLSYYSPPGQLDDLDSDGKAHWSQWLLTTINAAAAGRPQTHTNDSPRAQFKSELVDEPTSDRQDATVTWVGFPRNVALDASSDHQRWRTADASRDVQDEYCEWSVARNAESKITKVTFTCEGPEYWAALAAHGNAQKVHQLYQEHVSTDVQASDLFDASGQYIPRNRWNTDTSHGAMHLIQENNTLSAEIELAAAATIVREINGKVLTGAQELINCAKYGDAQRNSDPHIGAAVNGIARQKAFLTLTDPIGLYFDDLSVAGWSTPDGTDPKSFWTITRGSPTHAVRAVYQVPAAHGYSVGDITINDQAIQWGAQIADFITMKLSATAWSIGQSTVAPMTACVAEIRTDAPHMHAAKAFQIAVSKSR